MNRQPPDESRTNKYVQAVIECTHEVENIRRTVVKLNPETPVDQLLVFWLRDGEHVVENI
jgi:hypothetical protein